MSSRTHSEGTALLDELLPADKLVLHNIMALLEICTIVVSWFINKLMVLEHLLSNELWQEPLVLLGGDMRKVRFLPRSRLQARSDLLGRIVVLGTEYMLV